MALVEAAPGPNGIWTLILNDPARRNAMSEGMALAFRAEIGKLAEAVDARVLIVTGAGPGLSAGGDLEMLRQKPALSIAENRKGMLAFYEAFLCILQLPFPTICAIHGHAVGAGLALALACDLRLASHNALLGLTFTRLGLHPGMGVSFFLPRLIGYAAATELLTTGRMISAEEAKRLGLVGRVVAEDEIADGAQQLARELLRGGPQALAGLLRTLRPDAAELHRALQREADEQARNFASAEFAEGLAAIAERRRPSFRTDDHPGS